MAIAPALRGEDLARGLTAQERRRLQTATDLAVFRGSVERLRLRDFSGAVVFSDDGWLSGSPGSVEPGNEWSAPATDPAFQAAAAGATDVQVVDGGSSGRTVRVLQPIVADASGRSVGVLEILLPYEAVAADVEAATTRDYVRLGAGPALLYVVLAGISWSTNPAAAAAGRPGRPRRAARPADRAAQPGDVPPPRRGGHPPVGRLRGGAGRPRPLQGG